MRALQLVAVAVLSGCSASSKNPAPAAPSRPTADAITGCFLQPERPSALQPVIVESPACAAKFQFVEMTGECQVVATQPLILITANGMNVHLACVEGLNRPCEAGRRYTVTGSVTAVVDRRAFIDAECPLTKDLLGVSACREARAIPLGLVLPEGCTVRRKD